MCNFISISFAKDDTAKDMTLLKKQANNGNVNSAIEFAEKCINPFWQLEISGNFKCDAREGYLLVLKFADKGVAEAQQKVGELLLSGSGVAKNYQDSFLYSMKAAKQGNTTAQKLISDFYGNIGIVVDKSPIKAYVWFSIAHSINNNIRDSQKLSNLEGNLSKEDLLKAQQLSKKCQTSNYEDCD